MYTLSMYTFVAVHLLYWVRDFFGAKILITSKHSGQHKENKTLRLIRLLFTFIGRSVFKIYCYTSLLMVIALYIVTDCISTPLNRHSIYSACRYTVRVAHCISTYDLTDITAMNHVICCHALYELCLLRAIVSRLSPRVTCKGLTS